jgi:tetratricopeptide (TPR) repeat protein
VALFFDTFERTAPFLNQWLRDLYAGRYGDLPGELITTISGQFPLNPNLWGDYLPVIADFSLQPFSEAEARQFLASKNITDEPTIDVILTLSGRLPMWLATLAEARPEDAADIGDPAGDAVERFLKWEDDPNRRAVAVTAALPRTINQDVLGVITNIDKSRELFAWLCGRPFVTRQAESWTYHEVVRAAMLRLQRAQSPRQWRENHNLLARANAQWASEHAEGAKQTWSNADWVAYTIDETYHLLCADPVSNLPQALAAAVRAAESSIGRARQWAEILSDAGRDADRPVLQGWGQRLLDGIKDTDLTGYLTCLINEASLEVVPLVIALRQRGVCYVLAERYEEAIADFTRAIELDPKCLLAIGRRGEIYRQTGSYEEAFADFNRVIDLDANDARGYTSRGQTYQATGRHDEAIADFTRAIELDPDLDWAIAHRGESYRLLGRYEEALADFTRAVELDPDFAWAIGSRGQVNQAMRRHDEAIADFTRAIELDPDYAWAIGSRGQVHQAMRRHDEAIADFTRAIELDPDLADVIGIQLPQPPGDE